MLSSTSIDCQYMTCDEEKEALSNHDESGTDTLSSLLLLKVNSSVMGT